MDAENAARAKLYRLGYDKVFRLQYDGIHGVDLGAIKYVDEKAVAGAVIEVKGRSGPRPGLSVAKDQIRPSYYLPRIEMARQAGVTHAETLAKLAQENRIVSFVALYGKQSSQKLHLLRVPRRGPVSKTRV